LGTTAAGDRRGPLRGQRARGLHGRWRRFVLRTDLSARGTRLAPRKIEYQVGPPARRA